MNCFCYILECADGTYYTGWTMDPERRLAQHNKGTASRYTRSRLPVKLVYLEPQADRRTAMKRELAIKRMGRRGREKLVRGMQQTGDTQRSTQGNKYTGKQV